MIKIIVLIICCLVLTISCTKVPENFQDIQMRVESTIKQVKQTAETIHKAINIQSIKDIQQHDKENDLKKSQQEQDSDSEFEEQIFSNYHCQSSIQMDGKYLDERRLKKAKTDKCENQQFYNIMLLALSCLHRILVYIRIASFFLYKVKFFFNILTQLLESSFALINKF